MTVTTNRYRLSAIGDFEVARRWTLWDKIWGALRRQDDHLLDFNKISPWLRQKLYRGMQDIPVEAIVGSVNRAQDFNRNFRPLRDTSSRRWVEMHVLANEQGWPPIEVYKVGNLYFVEDGHHRVSVARYLKHHVIEAVVWDYNIQATFDRNTSLGQLKAILKKPQAATEHCTPCKPCLQVCAC